MRACASRLCSCAPRCRAARREGRRPPLLRPTSAQPPPLLHVRVCAASCCSERGPSPLQVAPGLKLELVKKAHSKVAKGKAKNKAGKVEGKGKHSAGAGAADGSGPARNHPTPPLLTLVEDEARAVRASIPCAILATAADARCQRTEAPQPRFVLAQSTTTGRVAPRSAWPPEALRRRHRPRRVWQRARCVPRPPGTDSGETFSTDSCRRAPLEHAPPAAGVPPAHPSRPFSTISIAERAVFESVRCVRRGRVPAIPGRDET